MSIISDKKYIAGCERYHLQPGYVFVTRKPSIITTVLGSCVSVCMYDTKNRFGGMNHFIYPKALHNGRTTQFGDVSVSVLYKTFREMGSRTKDLIAQIVGGAFLKDNTNSNKIARENIELCKTKLKKMKIKIISEDVGGLLGRKIIYITEYNELMVTKLHSIRETDFFISPD